MTLSDIKKEIIGWKFTSYKLINISIGVLALLIYEFIARPIYRPYIYANRINDFHIADTIGNSLGTLATVFIFIGLLTSELLQGKYLMRIIILGLVLYETAHPLLGKTIDIWDIIATLVTGVLSYLLFICLFRKKAM